MTIDTSKIKPGDTGTVRVTFGQTTRRGFVEVLYDDDPLAQIVLVSAIATHTPAPWVPEKGDVVGWSMYPQGEWTIVALRGDRAWVTNERGDHGVPCHSTLILIRKGAA